MRKKGRSLLRKIEGNLRARILAGFLVAIPLVVTYLVLRFLFVSADDLLQPLATRLMGRAIPGAGAVLTILLLYILGVIAASVVGRNVIRIWHSFAEKLPLVKNLYSVSRQVVDTFSRSEGANFRRVVILEWPMPGIFSIGMVTGQSKGPSGDNFLTIYVPTTPNPTSGFLTLVPESKVIDTDMSIEEGLKMVVSAGVLSPTTIKYHPPQKSSQSPP